MFRQFLNKESFAELLTVGDSKNALDFFL